MVVNDTSVKFWIEFLHSSAVFAGLDVGVNLYVFCTEEEVFGIALAPIQSYWKDATGLHITRQLKSITSVTSTLLGC